MDLAGRFSSQKGQLMSQEPASLVEITEDLTGLLKEDKRFDKRLKAVTAIVEGYGGVSNKAVSEENV